MSTLHADTHGLGDQSVVVVGGAGLIGTAICAELLALGLTVIAVDRDEDALDRLRRRHTGVRTETIDITRAEDAHRLEQLFDQEATRHLVLAQGYRNRVAQQRRLAYVEWLEVADVNLITPAYLAGAFCDALVRRTTPGSITALSSVHARILIGDSSYSASKAGLEMVIQELARTGAPHGVRVNGVAPGHVALNDDGEPTPSRRTPLGGHSLHPAAIGTAVRFLLCDHCSPYTTGITLTVDAGLSLYAPWSMR